MRSIRYENGFSGYSLSHNVAITAGGSFPGRVVNKSGRAYQAALQADTLRGAERAIVQNAALRRTLVWNGHGATFGNPHAFTCG